MPKKTAHPHPKPKRRATFIRAWRQDRGLKVWQLAERVGISEGQLSRVERGESAYTQDLLEAIADGLRCSVADLLMRNPADPEGLWTIYDQLTAPERVQAAAVVKALKRTG